MAQEKKYKTILNNSKKAHDLVVGAESRIGGKGSGKSDFSRGGERPSVERGSTAPTRAHVQPLSPKKIEGVENRGVLKVSKVRTLLTLCMIHQHPRVLLGMKKRGFGAGKWNGFGGHVEKGETIEAATRREIMEEAGLEVGELFKHGVIECEWHENPEILVMHVFRATDFSGVPSESEEMKPQWFEVEKLPYNEMWVDDKYWSPLLFAGKKFTAKFLFDSDDQIVEHTLQEVSRL